MIPRGHFNGLHKDHHPFSCLSCNHLARIVIQGAGVAFPDRLTYLLDGCAVVVDDGPSFDLDTAQFLVTLTRLNKTGETGITLQVDCLLRPGVCPENHFVIDEDIPHCYQVRPTIVIDGGDLECALLFKEGTYFFIVHT